ncbi:MAG: hypothetical protein LBR81_01350 [Prevotellaceae bacterium]|jgi:hypothetical protein|nr:hypothetical protein [Prevotellaceae bacterium]
MKSTKKTFSKRAIITLTLLSILNVFTVNAHHAEHSVSESSHLLSHILIGLAVLAISAGIFVFFNWGKVKTYFNR